MIPTNEGSPSLSTVQVLIIDTRSDAFDEFIAYLEREYEIRTTTIYDTNRISEYDDVDCIIGSPFLTEHSDNKSLETQIADTAVPTILFYEDETTASQMLTAGVDRCIRYNGRQIEAQAAHVAATLRQELRHQRTRRALRNEIEFIHHSFDAHNDILFAIDLDGNLIFWNKKLNEITGYPDAEIYEMSPADFITMDCAEPLSAAISRAISNDCVKKQVTLITKDDNKIPYEFVGTLLEDDSDNVIGIWVTGRDITDRERRERMLEDQSERLSVLKRLNEIIRDTHQTLVRASTREEIEQAVCANLVSENAYRFAWIGEQRAVDEDVEPREWAGLEDNGLDDRSDPDERSKERVTAETIIETSRMRVARSTADSSTVVSWQETALEPEYQSTIAIPLVYRETTHGVLCLHSSWSNSFDETERTVLKELGETIGYAFSAAECRRALVSDAVIELEFILRDRSIFTLDLTARTECRVTLDGIVERSDGMLAEFVTVTGVDPETVLDIAEEREEMDIALISEHNGESVFRLISESSSTVSLADQGGIIREGVAEDGEGHLVFELPQGADVHALVDAIQNLYSETELVAQRTRERTSTRGAEFRATFDDTLTDRQRQTLKTAYFSGYFEWPRESTGDEIAASFDISGPTFHEHLRAGQRKLLRAFIEHGPETRR
ncbi:bacterio-opsin activator domain-containing protein [Halocatena marina]|uniref:Bacterio-opsin activator domain-containing protein n=1 Tax=Halocatena marina TaxID=2934937 RepID=A0ABD5YZP3_9EURY|nr:bacterio-opsin activator domain-containing protein [Halocatena marina]